VADPKSRPDYSMFIKKQPVTCAKSKISVNMNQLAIAFAEPVAA
jgi:hypothetical protein